MPVISVSNLSKSYRLGTIGGGTLRGDLSRWWARARGRPDPTLKIGQEDQSHLVGQEFWALRDVNFDVQQGEILGIIGRNGAGKSTLLKILSRVTAPTSGEVRVKGRVASLLEVGTGFHPELTGRENVFLNGAILGMTKSEIRCRFDEIVAFAEIDKFVDTPVKRYSSGMYVRLAFAVAAHLEPEILVVDEVLAVGDTGFQKKCVGAMQEVARHGRTVLFVSHNMAAVRSLCSRGVTLQSGMLTYRGTTAGAISSYLDAPTIDSTYSGSREWDVHTSPGAGGFRLAAVRLSDGHGRVRGTFQPQESIVVSIKYAQLSLVRGMRIVLQVIRQGQEIGFTTTDHEMRDSRFCEKGTYTSCATIPGGLLNVGCHTIRIWAGIPGHQYLLNPLDALTFFVHGIGNHGSIFPDGSDWPGAVCPRVRWVCEADNGVRTDEPI